MSSVPGDPLNLRATHTEPGRTGNIMGIKKHNDFWAGAMFAAFGMFFAVIGRQYAIGTAANMGAGYFPRLLSLILILIGMVLLLNSVFTKASGEKVDKFDLRTIILILGPVLLFGLLLQPLGMIVSLFLVIVVSSYASHEFKWRSTVINAVILILMCVVIFVWSLKQNFHIWPFFLAR
jgi:hypothetical protein